MTDNPEPSMEAQLRVTNESEIESWRQFNNLPVPISIELGRSILTARSILALAPSSIVQLTRSTGDGVDVLAGDQRIARGEIVMIENHTGVRVNEILSDD